MKHLPLVIAPLVLLALSSCMDATSHVHIKKDGSGTITETVLMEKSAADTISSMAGAFQPQNQEGQAKTKSSSWWSEDSLKKRAQQLGEGVEFVSAENVTTDKGSGYRAIFNFKDITKVRINSDPNSHTPENPQAENDSENQTESSQDTPNTESQNITFQFTPGDTPRLTILIPDNAKLESEAQTQSDNPQQNTQSTPVGDAAQALANQFAEGMTSVMGAAMGQMFKGMRAKTIISFDGNITNTNARHRNGNEITLVDIDFEKLFGNPDAMKIMSGLSDSSYSDTIKALRGKVDMIYDDQSEVFVEFK